MTPLESAPGEGIPLPYEVAVDVVRRWKDFGNYGSRQKALAALQRRAGVPIHEADRLLDLVSAAHEAAVRAVPLHARHRRVRLNPFASADDIDHAACKADIGAAVPELPDAVRDSVLGWVVYWHWMR